MAQEGPGADCGSDARPFLPLGRVIRIPFSDLEQERWQDCLGGLPSFGTATETPGPTARIPAEAPRMPTRLLAREEGLGP